MPDEGGGPGPRLVADRYAILGELGRGGMGVVWRAEDVVIRRQVALKEVRFPTGMPDAERAVIAERVMREASTAGRLNSPSIVTVHDVLPQQDAVYIVMELVQARTLAELVERDGPLSPDRAITVALQLLSALRVAHSAGIVHRDVKPANIMVLPGDHVKLADFGIAHAIEDTRLTGSGMIGTPAYMAPELFFRNEPSPASDLWSLGVTLAFAVTGQSSFERASAAETMHAVLHGRPHQAAGPLAAVIDGLLTRDVRQRLTVEQALGMLNSAATPRWNPNIPPRRRKTALLVVVSLVVLVGLGVGAYLLLSGKPPDTSASDPCPAAPPHNLAVVDPTASAEATSQATTAVQRLFSYDYNNIAATESAAKELLSGAALGKYESTMAAVKQQAPTQKLVLTTSVIAAAPVELTDTDAKVLLFVNQQSVRQTDNVTSAGTAQILLTSARGAGTWKVQNLDAAPDVPRTPAATTPPRCPPAAAQQVADQRDAARDAGWNAVEVLNTVDRDHVEDSLTKWQKVATGELLDQLRDGRTAMVDRVKQAGTTSKGTAKVVAVSELDSQAGTARLLASVDTTVTSAQGTADRHVSLIVTLKRVGQDWKASSVTQAQ